MVQPRAEEKQSVVSRVKGAVKGAVSGVFNRNKTEETVEPQTVEPQLENIPSFQQYMYTTGSVGGNLNNPDAGRRSNRFDGYKTGIASVFGIDTELGEGARRQAVAELTTKGSKGTHYDYDVKYGNANSVGEQLKGNITSNGQQISEKDMRSNQPLRYTVGQNNMFTSTNAPRENFAGT